MFVLIAICLCIPFVWGLIEPQGEVTLQQLAQHVASMEHLLQNLTFQMQKLTSEINVIKKKEDTVVSFKAYASQSRAVSVGSMVIFDHIESNLGNGYNPVSGVFHAPIAGIYTFSAELQTTASGVSDYAIVNQGTREAFITFNVGWESKSTTAIFHVGVGADVFVKKMTDHGDNAPLRAAQETQFSGHLLRAD